jgi:glycosyltransferase involved in cell wall biosynthesis
MALRNSDKIFVNTRQVARELNCLYGVDSIVKPPGVSPMKSDQEETKHIPIDQPFVFTVSRLDARKRIDLLLRSFARLHEVRQELQLVVGGTGAEENRLKELASELGIEDSVVFVGYISEDDLAEYYHKAEIFACPGWMSYGLTPLEAVHSQTKVALSTDAFAKEVVENKDGVRLIPPNINKWTRGLIELIECDKTPSSTDIPTTKTHAESKWNEIVNI